MTRPRAQSAGDQKITNTRSLLRSKQERDDTFLLDVFLTPIEEWTDDQFERLKQHLPSDVIEQIVTQDQEWQEIIKEHNQDLLQKVTECHFAIMVLDSLLDSPTIKEDVRVALRTAIFMLNPSRLIDTIHENVRASALSFRQRVLDVCIANSLD